MSRPRVAGWSSSVKEGLKSRRRISGWTLPKQNSSVAPPNVWSNADQDPVPPERRTWTARTFVAYWFSDLVTVSTWSQGSSVVASGLSASDAMLICFVASMCNAVPIVLNGAIGSDIHIPFPIAARAAYGYWLSYIAVVSRAILALFWFGVNSSGKSPLVPTALPTVLTCLSRWPCGDPNDQGHMALIREPCEPSARISGHNDARNGIVPAVSSFAAAILVHTDPSAPTPISSQSHRHATRCHWHGCLDYHSNWWQQLLQRSGAGVWQY